MQHAVPPVQLHAVCVLVPGRGVVGVTAEEEPCRTALRDRLDRAAVHVDQLDHAATGIACAASFVTNTLLMLDAAADPQPVDGNTSEVVPATLSPVNTFRTSTSPASPKRLQGARTELGASADVMPYGIRRILSR